jgi:predicted transglutaminase-like cysteine proteinase
MVRLRVSAKLKQGFQVLVTFPLIITGLAITCAAVCLSFQTVLSVALKVSDHHSAEFRLPKNHPLLLSDLRLGPSTALSRVPDGLQQDIEFISFESRFQGVQPLLRSELRNDAIAGFASVPNGTQQDIQFIRFDVPTLAPMAFTRFCLQYPSDCETQRFTDDRIELNKMRWAELETINRTVNSSIQPARNEEGLTGEKWLLGPLRGDCNDYAVTKRHQLISQGSPARTVLLSEVVTVSDEHHLVTVARTDGGDLVLDNLTDRIMPWSRTPYRWVRIQMPKNPNYWASISEPNA